MKAVHVYRSERRKKPLVFCTPAKVNSFQNLGRRRHHEQASNGILGFTIVKAVAMMLLNEGDMVHFRSLPGGAASKVRAGERVQESPSPRVPASGSSAPPTANEGRLKRHPHNT